MNPRPVLATLAALSLATACSGKPAAPGPRTVVVEKEGRYAIGVQLGKKVEIYPLPAQPTVFLDGTLVPLSSTSAIGVIPKCPCSVPDCSIFCMPRWDLEPRLSTDPRTQTPSPAPPPTTTPP